MYLIYYIVMIIMYDLVVIYEIYRFVLNNIYISLKVYVLFNSFYLVNYVLVFNIWKCLLLDYFLIISLWYMFIRLFL